MVTLLVDKGRKRDSHKVISASNLCYFQFLTVLRYLLEIASDTAHFWWSSNPPRIRVHWAKWEKLFFTKRRGYTRIMYVSWVQSRSLGKTVMGINSLSRISRNKRYAWNIIVLARHCECVLQIILHIFRQAF